MGGCSNLSSLQSRDRRGDKTVRFPNSEVLQMARQRTPIALAKLTGQLEKHPERYRDRSDPPTNDLGPPSVDLSPAAVAVWMDLIDEMPWLCGGDKWIVGLAARLSALTQAPDCPIGIYAQLRLCLASMGGTPADRSKVQWDDEKSYDPMDEFIN